MGKVELTWLGHSTFLLAGDGKRLLLDPWLVGNPSCPWAVSDLGALDAVLVTHGHSDHLADAVTVARMYDAEVGSNPAIAAWLTSKGLTSVVSFDKGGTAQVGGFRVHMTQAVHSSEITDGDTLLPGGEAAGYVVELAGGLRIYHAGDTAVFGDMALIGRMLRPDLAILPIGDHFTMGPRSAAEAIRLLGVKRVVPMHWGTFPLLTGTPAALRTEAADVEGLEVLEMRAGEPVSLADPASARVL